MRIFLDVGGHYGETLDLALDPAWGFDLIYSFEPAGRCLNILRGFRDERVRIVPAAMSDTQGPATLFGAGLLGASLYADKQQLDACLEDETVPLLRATDWLLAHTSAGDEVYLKLNCEGSECDVLEDLLDSGAIDRVRSVYVDFDVRKIPSQAHRQRGVERRLRGRGVDFVTPEILRGDSREAVRLWLSRVSQPRRQASGRLRYRLGLHRPGYMWAVSIARATLPATLFGWAARRFGSYARLRPRMPPRGAERAVGD